jgi:hypothetical protein
MTRLTSGPAMAVTISPTAAGLRDSASRRSAGGDVRRRDTVAAGNQRMAELVEEDAGEARQDEGNHVGGRGPPRRYSPTRPGEEKGK